MTVLAVTAKDTPDDAAALAWTLMVLALAGTPTPPEPVCLGPVLRHRGKARRTAVVASFSARRRTPTPCAGWTPTMKTLLYLAPEVRGGFAAVTLMRFAEGALLSIGVREIRADSKLVNRADVLMRRLGYEPVALKFVKVFKEHDSVQ